MKDDGSAPQDRQQTVENNYKESGISTHADMSQDDFGLEACRNSLENDKPANTTRKRQSDSMGDIEDIMAQITSKMDTLSTEASKDDMLTAFVTVLSVETCMAEFFLESSAWNLETAISLYMENSDHINVSHSGMNMNMNMNMNSSGIGSMGNHPRIGSLSVDQRSRKKCKNMQYKQMVVEIAGLPADWTAHVSRSGGEIYFRHNDGTTQFQVPPGFADEEVEAENEASDEMADSSKSNEMSVTQEAQNGQRDRDGIQ